MPPDSLLCILCRSRFDLHIKLPCTQPCQHSLCSQCLDKRRQQRHETSLSCPLDNEPIANGQGSEQFINQPILILLYGRQSCAGHQDLDKATKELAVESQLEAALGELALLARDCGNQQISPQQTRRLIHLISATFKFTTARREFVRRLSIVFQRLLVELIQAQYTTKQREYDFIKLVKDLGCLLEPKLTDAVIDLLVKLYRAAGDCCTSASYERKVLVRFLLKELCQRGSPFERYGKSQVERVVQTLYRSSCFDVKQGDGVPSRLSLKEDLCQNVGELRHKYDTEIIRIAQTNCIRLSPDSLACLLYGRCSPPGTLSRIQSILDKIQNPSTVQELQAVLDQSGDKYGLANHMDELQYIQDSISELIADQNINDLSYIRDIVVTLTKLKHLFTVRQRREQFLRCSR